MLTIDEVKEFQKLVFKVYEVELTFDQAKDQGSRLIRLFELRLKSKKALVKNLKEVTK